LEGYTNATAAIAKGRMNWNIKQSRISS